MFITTPIWEPSMMKQREDICPVCHGWGYTDEVKEDLKCAPELKNKKTIALGSGCYNCAGKGIV